MTERPSVQFLTVLSPCTTLSPVRYRPLPPRIWLDPCLRHSGNRLRPKCRTTDQRTGKDRTSWLFVRRLALAWSAVVMAGRWVVQYKAGDAMRGGVEHPPRGLGRPKSMGKMRGAYSGSCRLKGSPSSAAPLSPHIIGLMYAQPMFAQAETDSCYPWPAPGSPRNATRLRKSCRVSLVGCAIFLQAQDRHQCLAQI